MIVINPFANCNLFSRSVYAQTVQPLVESRENAESHVFRSAWLCSKELSSKIRPVMDLMVAKEARDNFNRTNSFLPHVTLFSGNDLSLDACETIMELFFLYFPKGITLEVKNYLENAQTNPPVQLIFQPVNSKDQAIFDKFQRRVSQRLGLNIHVNNLWLHATLLYKTVAQPIANSTLKVARKHARTLLGQRMHFDQYALTTGRAWNPDDVQAWSRVNAQKFRSIRP